MSCYNNAELKADNSCSCTEGYYGSPASCAQCLQGCQICSSAGCTKCFPQWYLYGKECVTACPLGYLPKYDLCELGDLTPPDPSMFVNLNNSLIVSFSKPIHMNLTSSDIRVNVTDTSNVAYSLVWSPPVVLNDSSFLLNLSIDSPSLPDDNQCLLTFLHPATVVDLQGVAIVKTQLVGVLYGYGKSSLSNATLKAGAAAVAQGSVGAVAATSIISGSPTSFWSLLNQLQMITYIPMTGMPVPNGLMVTLGALNVGTFVPNPFHYILPTNESSQRPPDYAQRYEVDSSLFLLNTGLMMTTAVVLVLGFIPIYALSKCTTGPLSLYVRRFLPSFKWGIPLRWWIQSYLDISIYSLLEIQQTISHNGLSAVAVSFNFLLSLVLVCLSLATPLISFLFLWKRYRQMATREDEVFNKRWGVLYMEFDQKQNLGGLMYYPLFLTRRLVYALTIIWMSDFPKYQAVINTSMAFSVIPTQTLLYVLIYKPFPERIDHLGAIVGEASTLAVFSFSCFFFLSLSQSLFNTMETVAVWTVLGAIGINAVLSAVRTVYTFVTVYKEYRRVVERMQGKAIVCPAFRTSIPTRENTPNPTTGGLVMD